MITLNVDGASKGNPGHAGIGVRLASGDEVILEHCEYIGKATNNAAEYLALIKGLELACENKIDALSVISDSELIVRQMNGQYKVKNEALRPLYLKAQDYAKGFQSFSIRHVPRSENKDADRLANEGIQKGLQEISEPDGRAD